MSLFLPTFTTLLIPVHSENDTTVYFLIVLTTDYCWRSWTCIAAVAARACLPPGTSVCVAAPRESDQFCNQGIFSGFRTWGVNLEVLCSSIQCHSLPSPPISHPFSFLSLEIGLLNPTGGERCKFSQRGLGGAPAEIDFSAL